MESCAACRLPRDAACGMMRVAFGRGGDAVARAKLPAEFGSSLVARGKRQDRKSKP
jgi:hypothetical protein